MRFGVFEFRPASRELYRGGARVRLQAQPAQVLGLLLRRAGQVVTRAELKEAVWGSETFVDFDKGLNFCIAQVRTALGDSADAPLYIQTIAKHGYQFIAPVTPCGEESADTGQVVTAPTPVSPFRRWWLPGLAMLMAISGLLIFWGWHAWSVQHQSAGSQEEIRVAVARFDNETGDAEFDRLADTLSDLVTAKLTMSGADRYRVIGNARILRVPRSQRDLAVIGSSLNARYLVLAQVRKDASHFFVLAHLIRLPDQTHVAVTELTCTADNSLQDQSDMAQRVADKFSPLIARLNTVRSASSSDVNR